MQIGYARVSTDEQNLSLQLDALRRAGCSRIFHDQGVSGIALTRPALGEALAALRPGCESACNFDPSDGVIGAQF